MRKHWILALGIFLLLTGLVIAGLTWYLNNIFLPGPARQWIASYLAETTGRRIQMGELSFRIWEGISIRDVVIYEDKTLSQEPFLEIERVSFAFLYIPLVKNRELWIPSFRIQRPRLRLMRLPPGQAGNSPGRWNVQSLRFLDPKKRAAQPIKVIVPKLLIENGELLVEDQELGPPWNATLTRIDLKGQLGLPHTARVKATAQWQTQPVTPLLLNAQWDIVQQSGQVTLAARQMPIELLRDFLPKDAAAFLQVAGGTATITAKAMVHPTEAIVMVKAATSGLRGQWQELKIDGDLSAVAYGTFKQNQGWKLSDPEVAIDLHSITLHPPAPWPAIEQLAGTLQANPKQLATKELSAQVHGLTWKILLDVEGTQPSPWWTKPVINVQATTQEPLEKLWAVAQTYAPDKTKEIQVSGKGELWITAQGPLPQIQTRGVMTVQEATFEHPALGRMEQIQGRIFAEPNLMRASDLTGSYLGKPLSLEGTLADFSKPEIDCAFSWGELSGESSLRMEEPAIISIARLDTRYRKSQAKTTGDLDLTAAPRVNLHSDFSAALEDLPHLFPAAAPRMEPLGLRGTVQGRLSIDGDPRHPEALECLLKGRAGRLEIKGFHLENLQGEYRQKEGVATVSNLTALAYGGKMVAGGIADLRKPQIPIEGKISVAQLELGRLIQDTEWKKNAVSGLLSVESTFKGVLASLQKSLTAQGRLQVANGQLFEIPLLKGLPDFLGATGLKHVQFKEAVGNFSYEAERLSTSDMTLYSNLATMTAAGTVGPEKALNLRIVASIDPAAFEQGGALAKQAGAFLNQAGYLIGEIKVTGTLDDPKRELVPVSFQRMVTEQIFKGLKGVLKGVFE